MSNLAFIDGQNLHLGTKTDGWKIDLFKFRIYLKDKFNVEQAFYFLGCLQEEHDDLYNNLQKAGFTIVFKSHSEHSITKKKGNVDTDIVFEIMKNLVENFLFDKIVLVSGDGDYKKMVDYLINKEKFLKILFPNQKFASSLYKKLGNEFFMQLGQSSIRGKIEQKKRVP